MSAETKSIRQPVVVVLGHVDHGKTTLLDYIKKTSVASGEHGGITQHVGAYEVEHTDEDGVSKPITFIDTPGHAAFGAMRKRGAAVADIAILVVAADDGVKPQTLEAIEAIQAADIPFIVAINKMDKPGVTSDKTKQSLAEAGVYVEGYGGTIPFVEVSGKTGMGIDALLSLILLQASLDELKTQTDAIGTAVVIESHRDPKRGTLATLIVLDGKLKRGDYIVIGKDMGTLRILTDWSGKNIESASAGKAVIASGFSEIPSVGEELLVYPDKRTAAAKAIELASRASRPMQKSDKETEVTIPIIIKADTTGTLEAIVGEVSKRDSDKVSIKIVNAAVGNVTESDIKLLLGSTGPVVIAFNISVDRHAEDLADKNGVPIEKFNIIYKLTEWLDEHIAKVTPKVEVKVTEGVAKILKTFSKTKDKQVIGGVVEKGEIKRGKRLTILRRGEQLGEGKLVNLQKMRVDADTASEGEQFGAVVETKITLVDGDTIES